MIDVINKQCDLCNISVKSLKSHIAHEHKGVKPWSCEKCGKAWSDRRGLQTHIEVGNCLKCKKCDFSAETSNDLLNHATQHKSCKKCGKEFNDNNSEYEAHVESCTLKG